MPVTWAAPSVNESDRFLRMRWSTASSMAPPTNFDSTSLGRFGVIATRSLCVDRPSRAARASLYRNLGPCGSKSPQYGHQFANQRIGMRYRFRDTVIFENADIPFGPSAKSPYGMTLTPGQAASACSDANPPAGVCGSIDPGVNGSS